MAKRESKRQNASQYGKMQVETAKYESKQENAAQDGKMKLKMTM